MAILWTLLVIYILWESLWIILGLKQMSPWELRKRLAAGERIRIVDVRTRTEYKLLHIRGSESAPLFTGSSFDKVMDLHGDPGGPPTTVVVCMTGHRSPLVAWQMMKTGITDTHNLVGGMLLWKLTGGATASGPESK